MNFLSPEAAHNLFMDATQLSETVQWGVWCAGQPRIVAVFESKAEAYKCAESDTTWSSLERRTIGKRDNTQGAWVEDRI